MAFEAMKNAAVRLGWTMTPADPGVFDIDSMVNIYGEERGVPVRLDRCASMYSFSTSAFLRPAIPWNFLITPEGVGSAVKHLLGFHDVETGDVAFDKMFNLQTSEPEKLKRLLTPGLKQRLVKLFGDVSPVGPVTFGVSQAGVIISRVYLTNMITTENVTRDIPLAVDMVEALKSEGAATYR